MGFTRRNITLLTEVCKFSSMAYQKPTRVFTLDSSDELGKADCCTRTEILCAPAGSSPLHFHSLIYSISFKELTMLHRYFSTFNAVTRPACVCQKNDDGHSQGYRCCDVGSVIWQYGNQPTWFCVLLHQRSQREITDEA